jgi:hypothetical protein
MKNKKLIADMKFDPEEVEFHIRYKFFICHSLIPFDYAPFRAWESSISGPQGVAPALLILLFQSSRHCRRYISRYGSPTGDDTSIAVASVVPASPCITSNKQGGNDDAYAHLTPGPSPNGEGRSPCRRITPKALPLDNPVQAERRAG